MCRIEFPVGEFKLFLIFFRFFYFSLDFTGKCQYKGLVNTMLAFVKNSNLERHETMNAYTVYPTTIEEFKSELLDLFRRVKEDETCFDIILPDGSSVDKERVLAFYQTGGLEIEPEADSAFYFECWQSDWENAFECFFVKHSSYTEADEDEPEYIQVEVTYKGETRLCSYKRDGENWEEGSGDCVPTSAPEWLREQWYNSEMTDRCLNDLIRPDSEAVFPFDYER